MLSLKKAAMDFPLIIRTINCANNCANTMPIKK